MVEKLDETSQQIHDRLQQALVLLDEAGGLLGEIGQNVRSERPNFYRLESAVEHAQQVLTWANPRITRDAVSQELVVLPTDVVNTADRRPVSE
jgi:hypothetical protein